MDAHDVLALTTAKGLAVVVDGADLVLYPAERLTPDLRSLLVAHKAEIIGLLHAPWAPPAAVAEAVAAWMAAGRPRGDPALVGANLLALQKLAHLPPGERSGTLRAWRRELGLERAGT